MVTARTQPDDIEWVVVAFVVMTVQPFTTFFAAGAGIRLDNKAVANCRVQQTMSLVVWDCLALPARIGGFVGSNSSVYGLCVGIVMLLANQLDARPTGILDTAIGYAFLVFIELGHRLCFAAPNAGRVRFHRRTFSGQLGLILTPTSHRAKEKAASCLFPVRLVILE